MQVKVPVIVVGCKLDLRDEHQQISLESVMSPIMQTFREIETCIECSAYKQIQVGLCSFIGFSACSFPSIRIQGGMDNLSSVYVLC